MRPSTSIRRLRKGWSVNCVAAPSRRLCRATLATVLGWMAGILATLPFQLIEVVRNTSGDSGLLVSALGYGLAIWFFFTLLGVVIAWVIVVLPTALFVSAAFLLRRRAAVILISTLCGMLVVGREFRIWTVLDHPALDLANFWLYLVFSAAFAAVTSWFYLRLLARNPACC